MHTRYPLHVSSQFDSNNACLRNDKVQFAKKVTNIIYCLFVLFVCLFVCFTSQSTFFQPF